MTESQEILEDLDAYTTRADYDVLCAASAKLIRSQVKEIERLSEADQIIQDLMSCDHWRTPRNDIYPRMLEYLDDSKERPE